VLMVVNFPVKTALLCVTGSDNMCPHFQLIPGTS
jgi:hypothetical protein